MQTIETYSPNEITYLQTLFNDNDSYLKDIEIKGCEFPTIDKYFLAHWKNKNPLPGSDEEKSRHFLTFFFIFSRIYLRIYTPAVWEKIISATEEDASNNHLILIYDKGRLYEPTQLVTNTTNRQECMAQLLDAIKKLKQIDKIIKPK